MKMSIELGLTPEQREALLPIAQALVGGYPISARTALTAMAFYAARPEATHAERADLSDALFRYAAEMITKAGV